MDDDEQAPPDVTISSADNGHIVRWHQRGKKGDPGGGREVKRVASTKEEALGHADEALGGGGSTKSSKKRSVKRDGQTGSSATEGDGGSASSPTAQSSPHASRAPRRRTAARRRSRIGGRR